MRGAESFVARVFSVTSLLRLLAEFDIFRKPGLLDVSRFHRRRHGIEPRSFPAYLLPHSGSGLEPRDAELIAPVHETRARHAAKPQVFERFRDRNGVDQSRKLTIKEGRRALLDQRGREPRRSAYVDPPLGRIRWNIFEVLVDAQDEGSALLAKTSDAGKTVRAVAREREEIGH